MSLRSCLLLLTAPAVLAHTPCLWDGVASTHASLPSCLIVKVKEGRLIKVSELGDKGLEEER